MTEKCDLAFIALVAILVIVIVVSCSAVVYIMREDALDDAEAQNHPARGRYQLSVPPSDPTYRGTAQTYFARILGNISGSRKSGKGIRTDKSRIPRKHRGQGWMQAGNGADGDSDSADEHQATRKQKSKNSNSPTSMTVSDLDSVSLTTLSYSNRFPPTTSQLSSPSSDAVSSVRFDPHGIRGLSYADQLPSLTHQATMPSIQSQLYSPRSSQSFVSSPSQMTTTLPESLEGNTSPTSTDNDGDPFPADPRPPLRTFESGSKFIEGL
jgi:hypothetical protein